MQALGARWMPTTPQRPQVPSGTASALTIEACRRSFPFRGSFSPVVRYMAWAVHSAAALPVMLNISQVSIIKASEVVSPQVGYRLPVMAYTGSAIVCGRD